MAWRDRGRAGLALSGDFSRAGDARHLAVHSLCRPTPDGRSGNPPAAGWTGVSRDVGGVRVDARLGVHRFRLESAGNGAAWPVRRAGPCADRAVDRNICAVGCRGRDSGTAAPWPA